MKANHIFAIATVGGIFLLIVGFFIVKAKEDTSIASPVQDANPTSAFVLGGNDQNQGLALNGNVGNNNSTKDKPMDVTELKIEDVKEGTGAAIKAGDTVVVNYEGKLLNGQVFDSSFTRNQPFETPIGVGRVIPGWDQGMIGMKIGGKRVITIPSKLAYGEAGAGNGVIPPNAGLIFTIELLDIKSE